MIADCLNILQEDLFAMKKSRIVSGLLAGVMAASIMTVGFSASAATAVAKPTNVKAVNAAKGIKVTWKKVTGAKKYQVIRNKKVVKNNVSATSYTDTSVKKGTIYKYQIKAVNGKKKSKASKAVTVKRLVAPTITRCEAKITGAQRINVYWSKSLGTDMYKLYRKAAGETKYTMIKEVTGKRSHADKTIKAGVKYTYKVKAFYKKTSSSVASATKSNTYLSKPEVTMTFADGKYTLTWDAVKGATSYAVVDGKKNTVATVKTTSYTADVTDTNYAILNYGVVAKCATSDSANAMDQAVFVPQGAYYTDKEGNLHAFITLKAGEKFTDGAIAAAYILAQNSKAEFSIKGFNDAVATVENFVINAVAAGTTTFTVSYDQEAAKIVNDTLALHGYNFGNKLTTGVAFVEVTVQ